MTEDLDWSVRRGGQKRGGEKERGKGKRNRADYERRREGKEARREVRK